MEKLNINKLIANDIVNYGLDKTTCFSYIVSLNDFLDDYDDESIEYIRAHINDIKEAVRNNENVSQLFYDEERHEFDMTFYYDGLFSKLDKQIYNLALEMGTDFDPEEVWEISYNIENSEEYIDMLATAIKDKSKANGREI